MHSLGDRAFYNLIRFWTWVAQSKPDGDLSSLDPVDIEIASDWRGETGAFFAALVERKFVDVVDGRCLVHDWQYHNEYASHAPERSEQARHAAKARWKKEHGKMPVDAGSNAGSINQQCPSPFPFPFPDKGKEPPGGLESRDQPSAPSEVFFKNQSRHFRHALETALTDIKQSCDIITSLPQKSQKFNPYQAVQKAVNNGMHPDAIRETAAAMAREWDTPNIRVPWGWWRSKLKKLSQNAWEKVEASKAETYKQAIVEASTSGLLEKLGLKIKTIGSGRTPGGGDP